MNKKEIFKQRKLKSFKLQDWFSVVFLGPRANAELVLKFHVALHSSHSALPMVALKSFALM
jgi:hypothetical protein